MLDHALNCPIGDLKIEGPPYALNVAWFPCRHWQDLGYLILYITARPDMQQRKVVAWLAQHNFPHGMVAFMDGLSAEPLKQKGNYLRQLIQEVRPRASFSKKNLKSSSELKHGKDNGCQGDL